ncbi:uncharacterized protein MKK02DRAFT_39387 [Dioszegia hungarica]|uniref:Uncharacterized protein n=1 Tax=Dioszegia hungarica TaxID=4972 RepID=A0AA38HGH5_9TREE|nr:uncharacterized protein MKK02DRAFT_39387 [Dioszegia hungarica]KAI9639109.1 hypothetical protein MKK02DRAFT_39387 [Dioszegia hungarica]
MTRRLLATLSALPSSSATPPPLAPPYAHSTAPRSTPSLRPPYAHSLSPSTAGGSNTSRINAPYRFSIPPAGVSGGTGAEVGQAEAWRAWAMGVLGSEEGRRGVEKVWEETLEGLERAKVDSSRIPAVSYLSLSEYLANPTAAQAIKSTGSVVVRDVIPDGLALAWARDISEAMSRRGGDAVYWHPALLAARSNPSLLNTSSAILSALSGTEGDEAYILAESVREGLGNAGAGRWSTGDVRDVWAVRDETAAVSTPLLSHLALTPPTSSPTSIYSTIHTAAYALLRPFFCPVRSRISFYSSAEYLSASNWRLAEVTEITSSTAVSGAGTEQITEVGEGGDRPHLLDLPVTPISLNPGDVILRNSLLPSPISTSTSSPESAENGQAFLPLTLLPRTTNNTAHIALQRRAYEAGLPPKLGAAGGDGGGGWGERGAIRVEETFGEGALGGSRGRGVMGY